MNMGEVDFFLIRNWEQITKCSLFKENIHKKQAFLNNKWYTNWWLM